jgi:translation initiation factor IF-3
LIDETGAQLGVVAVPEALKLAKERGFDLVMVSPSAVPPVCRIADYGKLKYELNKKEKEARKSQKGGSVKEVKLSPKIAQHDFDVRVKKTLEFLEKTHAVKLSMFFRGREMAHVDLGLKVINRLLLAVEAVGKPESEPKKFGKSFIVVVSPK